MRTLNQQRLLTMERYIIDYQKENGQSPTYRQIMQAMNMSSLNLVQRYVKELESEGRITVLLHSLPRMGWMPSSPSSRAMTWVPFPS